MDYPVELNNQVGVPLYKQLFNSLRTDIEAGKLRNGQLLPSTRDLGSALGVSRDTVIKTYGELANLGYVNCAIGSGTVVTFNLPVQINSINKSKTNLDTEAILSTYAQKVMSINLSNSTSGDKKFLNYGAPPRDILPMRSWRSVLLKQRQHRDQIDYSSDTFGFEPLRQAISEFLARSKGIQCTKDQIIVFNSSQDALDLIARLFVNENDDIVLENPGYCGAKETFRSHGSNIHPIDIDEKGMKVDQLLKLPKEPELIYVSPSHHDPLGIVMSLDRRKALMNWSETKNTLIVEDDFDSDYRYGSKPLPSLHSMCRKNSILYIYSFWKLLFPIISLGCLVVPPNMIELFSRAKLLTQRNFPMIEHYALAEFISDGNLEKFIRSSKRTYTRRRQMLIAALTRQFGNRIYIPKESAGLHMTVQFKFGCDDKKIESSAKEVGLPLVSTASYYIKDNVIGEFLVSFASMKEESIEAIVFEFARRLVN